MPGSSGLPTGELCGTGVALVLCSPGFVPPGTQGEKVLLPLFWIQRALRVLSVSSSTVSVSCPIANNTVPSAGMI